MKLRKPLSVRCIRLPALMLFIVVIVSGCSGPNESSVSDTQPSSDPVVSDASTSPEIDTPNEISDTVEVVEPDIVTETNNPAVADPSIQNTVTVNFEITVPQYQSDELRVELVWDDINLNAMWVGDEFWSASGEFPTDTEHPLTVTFYDLNGDLELARSTQAFRTGVNATEAFQISADQFNADQFDTDADGVSNLDESIAGTSPIIDEDSLLEIRSSYTLGRWDRMSVSGNFESFVTNSRPLLDTIDPVPPYPGFPGSFFGDVDIDANGNGTVVYGYYWPIEQLRYAGTRTHSGSSITWEGTRSAYDGDYRHGVSFSSTVTVVDESTRELVQQVSGSNSGAFRYTWETNSSLTGALIEGTSQCKPVAGTFSATYRTSPGGVTEYSIRKELGDSYWRVVRVDDEAETTEFFVRELIMFVPRGSDVDTVPPEEKYFTCDFVDI